MDTRQDETKTGNITVKNFKGLYKLRDDQRNVIAGISCVLGNTSKSNNTDDHKFFYNKKGDCLGVFGVGSNAQSTCIIPESLSLSELLSVTDLLKTDKMSDHQYRLAESFHYDVPNSRSDADGPKGGGDYFPVVPYKLEEYLSDCNNIKDQMSKKSSFFRGNDWRKLKALLDFPLKKGNREEIIQLYNKLKSSIGNTEVTFGEVRSPSTTAGIAKAIAGGSPSTSGMLTFMTDGNPNGALKALEGRSKLDDGITPPVPPMPKKAAASTEPVLSDQNNAAVQLTTRFNPKNAGIERNQYYDAYHKNNKPSDMLQEYINGNKEFFGRNSRGHVDFVRALINDIENKYVKDTPEAICEELNKYCREKNIKSSGDFAKCVLAMASLVTSKDQVEQLKPQVEEKRAGLRI